jgi:RimJ/RimL family protein N-acetyltransferase
MTTELALFNPDLCSSGGSAKAPLDFRREITLTDGTRAALRPICSADKESLVEFHSRLSAESLFLRYHYSKGQLTESDLHTLCDIDYSTTMALVAEVERNGKPEIIGVGRYIRLPFDHTAEVAFIVQDADQNKGVGTQLLRHLSTLAWQKEIYFFFGEVLRQNSKMLSIFRKSDPAMKQEADSPTTCSVTFSVAESMRRAS